MSGAVIFNGDYVKALKSKLKLGEAAYIETGSADPTTLSLGVPTGSLYLRSNGTLYVKYASSVSAWAPALTTGTGGTLTSTALEDSSVYFVDETDPTKKLYFQLSGISNNTSRTLTIPNLDGSIALGTGTANYVTYWSATNSLAGEAQLSPIRGGTGINNTGLFSYGSNNITLTTTASTSVTLPTSGTLATLAGAEALTNKTINSSSIGATTASSGAFTFLTLKGTGTAGTAYFDLLNETTPSSPNAGYTRLYFKPDGALYAQNSAAEETKIGVANTIAQVTQALHGFTSADIGRPVYLNGSTYAYAKADATNTAEVAGLVYGIIDVNTFYICLGGEVASVGANLIEGGGALISGEAYFLSPTAAGKITTTAPSVIGQVSKPVGVARTTTAIDFYNMRGSVVGGANARTQISLSNNAITTIQTVSTYDAGELVGWVHLDAGTDYRFYVQAQFAKNGMGTDYIIGYQTMGDVPPLGFNITITTLGLIQITLPNIAGFTNASVNFALNAPAVGATFPLTVGGNNIVANYRAVTGTYTITPSDYYVSASGAAGYTINLPVASTVSGKIFIVKSRLNAGQVLTIDADGSETIDGALTIGLFQNESCYLVSNGTSWEMF